MDILFGVIDSLKNPVIFSDLNGVIKKINNAGKIKFGEYKHISNIIPDWDKQKQKYVELRQEPHLIKIIRYEKEELIIYFFDASETESDIIIENVADAIVIVDYTGKIELVNKAFSRISGLERENLIGRNIMDLYKEDIILSEPVSLDVVKEKKTVTKNVRYIGDKVVTYTSIPLFDEEGEVAKVVNTGRDITELIELKDRLEKTENLKNIYFSKLKLLEEYFYKNQIIYSSKNMEDIVRKAIKIGPTDSSVIILGESGVGKEVIAQLVYESSNRKNAPFVIVNCAAIPKELLESELFGYEEGSFTGAKKGGKKGLFEEANNGTIFLDEVGELPLILQSKLLRILQENKFMKVGGNKVIPINVRIISATNLSITKLTDPNIFRRDLFYRLCVIPIIIPPLRNRKEDIFPLLKHFLVQLNKKYNYNKTISNDLIQRFNNYDWPGNVRELKNVIEQLVIMSDKQEITGDDFDRLSHIYNTTNETKSFADDIMPLRLAVQKVEETLICKAYKECGSILKAAEVLDINPSTIHRKIKQGVIKLY